jgi:uncharacterized protein (TIGR02284 family)
MGVDLNETIDILNDLVRTLRDDQEAFREAAEKVRDGDLKIIFMDYSTERARFLGEVQNEIERLGVPDPADSGTVTGRLRRGWMNLKAALASDRDDALIEECEKAEDAAIERYGKVLSYNMPRYIREMLEKQLEQIGKERARLAELRRKFSHGPQRV